MGRLWRKLKRKVVGRGRSPRPSTRQLAYLAHKEQTRIYLKPIIEAEAIRIGVVYGRVAIKDNNRSWGSCSAKGNLNFHYKLLFLPEHLVRYVIVHELCHRRHLHHRLEFWNEMALWYPTYEECRRELRMIEKTIGMSRVALLAYRDKVVNETENL